MLAVRKYMLPWHHSFSKTNTPGFPNIEICYCCIISAKLKNVNHFSVIHGKSSSASIIYRGKNHMPLPINILRDWSTMFMMVSGEIEDAVRSSSSIVSNFTFITSRFTVTLFFDNLVVVCACPSMSWTSIQGFLYGVYNFLFTSNDLLP